MRSSSKHVNKSRIELEKKNYIQNVLFSRDFARIYSYIMWQMEFWHFFFTLLHFLFISRKSVYYKYGIVESLKVIIFLHVTAEIGIS